MLTRRRVTVVVLLLLLVATAYTAWRTYQVQRDLSAAQTSAKRLANAVQRDDPDQRVRQLELFRDAAAAAEEHTGGTWWGALTHVPVLGDDAEGVRVLSAQLDAVAKEGVEPLVSSLDGLDDVAEGGQIDLDAVRDMQQPVRDAHRVFETAQSEVGSLDSSGFAGPLKTPFEEFEDQLGEASDALAAAEKATELLPDFLGGQGTRRYLLVFQNNAEIRATGGLPGSWAELVADDGRVRISRQGTGSEFRFHDTPILPLDPAEVAVYTELPSTFFLDTNFIPDFPRAAELMRAFWEERYTDQLDGVLTIDPVALSYLLEGTGPVRVQSTRLTEDTAVQALLNEPYLSLPPEQQDAFFAEAAQAIFDAATTDLRSPIAFTRALVQAADEDRFRVAPFVPSDAETLGDSEVLGAVPDDDGLSPRVLVTLNDGTGGKMSYYLRYRTEVEARGCQDGRQTLLGSMTLNQTIPEAQAKQLPLSVNGGGLYGVEPGKQLVFVRIYGPTGGTVSDIKIDGAKIVAGPVQLGNRPVVTIVPEVTGRDDVLLTWQMTTGPDQTRSGTVDVTPSVVPGDKDFSFASAC